MAVSQAVVAPMAAEAHKLGLRFSGHVPNGMIASQFIAAGADELQHINFVMLNFLDNKLIDTRTPARFTAVAEQADGDRPRWQLRRLLTGSEEPVAGLADRAARIAEGRPIAAASAP